jgi:uncharacterized protein YndB with AHSA1/START domain
MTADTGTVRFHRVLRAPPQRVYRAFTHPEAKAKWLPPYGFVARVHRFDARLGGGYAMSFINFSGGSERSFESTYTVLEPDTRIGYTTRFDDPNLPGEMQVEVLLRPVMCGTEVQIVQIGHPGGHSHRDVLPRLAGIAVSTRRSGRTRYSRRRLMRPLGWAPPNPHHPHHE